MNVTRETLKSIGIWTLQRRNFEDGCYDYHIKASNLKNLSVDLFVNERTDHKTGRTAFEVEYSHFSKHTDLTEAALFIEQANVAVAAGLEFQEEINSREGVLNPAI